MFEACLGYIFSESKSIILRGNFFKKNYLLCLFLCYSQEFFQTSLHIASSYFTNQLTFVYALLTVSFAITMIDLASFQPSAICASKTFSPDVLSIKPIVELCSIDLSQIPSPQPQRARKVRPWAGSNGDKAVSELRLRLLASLLLSWLRVPHAYSHWFRRRMMQCLALQLDI